jgi:hypothetical protein
MYEFAYQAQFGITHWKNPLDAARDLLNRRPHTHFAKGDLGRHGRRNKVSYVGWLLHTGRKQHSEKIPLQEVLAKFLLELAPKKRLLRQVLRGGGRAALEIAIRPKTSYSLFTLGPSVFSELAALGVEMDICCIVPPGQFYNKENLADDESIQRA